MLFNTFGYCTLIALLDYFQEDNFFVTGCSHKTYKGKQQIPRVYNGVGPHTIIPTT